MQSSNNKYLLLFLILFCISFCSPLFAEKLSTLSLSELLNTKVISSATKLETSINDAPASASIITSNDIKTYGYKTLADVLAAERSFYLAYDRNYTYIGSRGFSRSGDYNRRTLIMVDGFRVNDGYYEQGFVGTPFPIDMDLVEQIEIVRGANSALFGSNAILSVVNVVTKKPKYNDGPQVAVAYGSQNSQKARVSWFGSEKNGETSRNWSISATRYHSDGNTDLYYPEFDEPLTNEGVYQDNDSDDVSQFYGQYTYNKLRISGYHSKREKAVPTASFGTLFNAPGAFTIDQKSQIRLDYSAELSSGITSATRAYIDRYYYTGDYIYEYPPVTINRDLTDVYSRAIEQQFSARNGQHTWIAGVEYRDDWRYLGQNYDVEPYALYVENKGNKSRAAVFIQDEFIASQQWRYVFGARWDDYQLFGSTFNPKLAIIYNQTDKARWKFLAGRAFRAPSIPEQSKAGRQQDPMVLTPEINHNLELVFEYSNTEESQFLFTIYQNKGTDTIKVDATSDTGTGFINAADTIISNGFESEYLFRNSDGTQFSASYGYLNSLDNNELVATNSPEHLFKLKWAKDLSGDWRMGLNAQYMSERKTAKGFTVDSFFLAHLNLNYYGFQKYGWRVQAAIYNLFDTTYADPPSTNFRQTQITQDGRTLKLSAEWEF